MGRRVASLSCALTTLAALTLGAVVVPAIPAGAEPSGGDGYGAAPAPVTARQASAPAAEEEPLRVRITSMTPSVIPRNGPLRFTGSVTNTTDELWSLINLQPFLSSTPITTLDELALSADGDPQGYYGDRFVDERALQTIPELQPGATAFWSVRIPGDLLDPWTEPGVYTVGVQALGQTAEGRDEPADGRARTFAPLVTGDPDPARVSLVVPVRREVRLSRGGRVLAPRKWRRDLGPGGRLRNVLDFASESDPGAITWLVDPAVLVTLERLAAGNPVVDLGPTSEDEEPTGTPDSTPGSPDSSAPTEPDLSPPALDPDEGSDEGSDGAQDGAQDESLIRRWSAEWLERFRALAGPGTQVLGLPYGDVDVAAASRHDPEILDRAWQLSSSTFDRLGLSARRAVSPPSGLLDPLTIEQLDPEVDVLVSDQLLSAAAVTTVADALAPDSPWSRGVVVSGHDVDLYDSAASAATPAPGEPLAALAVRQRLAAEAALRAIGGDESPLVMAMPGDWDPGVRGDFWEQLDRSWLDIGQLTATVTGSRPEVPAGQIAYPQSEADDELDAANLSEAEDLVTAGRTVANVLVRSEGVEATVTGNALTTLSYAWREAPTAAGVSAGRMTRWLQHQLRQIRIAAPAYVTLPSSSGAFRVDVTNRLEQPVAVHIETVSDNGLSVEDPPVVQLDGGASQSLRLRVTSELVGVHEVRLLLTDEEGTRLGAQAAFPVRPSQSGRVIWGIIAVGVGLLFGAIVLRNVQRLRRRGGGS